MNIKSLIPLSMVDWDGKTCSTIFTGGCNYKCPACHNAPLVLHSDKLFPIPNADVLQTIESYINYIDGVCITGGEPTLQVDLPYFCRKLKDLGLQVKVDTNGFNPFVILDLYAQKLIDYVAFDIKAPLTEEAYSKITGTKVSISTLADIDCLAKILIHSDLDYEFRTTVIPGFHKPKDIERICKYVITSAKKYAIQNFHSCDDLINPKLNKLKPFTPEEMQEFYSVSEKYISNVVLRN